MNAELYSTYLITSGGSYFIDPIPLQREALDELIGSGRVVEIIVTNGNHHHAAAEFAEHGTPILSGASERLQRLLG